MPPRKRTDTRACVAIRSRGLLRCDAAPDMRPQELHASARASAGFIDRRQAARPQARSRVSRSGRQLSVLTNPTHYSQAVCLSLLTRAAWQARQPSARASSGETRRATCSARKRLAAAAAQKMHTLRRLLRLPWWRRWCSWTALRAMLAAACALRAAWSCMSVRWRLQRVCRCRTIRWLLLLRLPRG
jgi:hypothetical protein